jgi:predicted RNA-binding protein YlqC (UPF0109 family)
MSKLSELGSLVQQMVTAMVRQQDAVEVTEAPTQRTTVITVRVADGEAGKVVGRGGRVADAMRVILRAAASERLGDHQVILDVLNDTSVDAPRKRSE